MKQYSEVIDPARRVSTLDRRLLGSFLEHLGHAMYTGIYEPGSPRADSNGFRTDVMEEIRGLGVPIVRYPGGTFCLRAPLAGRRSSQQILLLNRGRP